MESRQVGVVGGGIAGLTAAIFAAREGAAVELFETGSRLGGRARTRVEHGYSFNMGPHALYRHGTGQRTLDELGIELSGRSPEAAHGFARHRGALHALPAGAASLLTTRLFSLPEKLEFGRVITQLGREAPERQRGRTLAELLAARVRHRTVKDAIAALVRLATYAHAPDALCAEAALAQLQLAQSGSVQYLDGGWQRMIDALAAHARGLGVTVRTGQRVRQVVPAGAPPGAGWTLQLGSDGSRRFDAVVLALGPREASALVGHGTDPFLLEHAERALPARAACLDVALERLPHPRRRFALGIDAPTYFSVHTPYAELAPAGGSVVHVARYLAPGEKPERAELEPQLEALLDQMQPGWRDVCVGRTLLRDARASHAIPHARHGGLPGRAPIRVPDRPGLLLAGDWVGAHGQLADAAFSSGRAAGHAAAVPD